jgi:hypothetical protein
MLQRIREMIEKTPVWCGKIIRFACMVGLRPCEVVESVRLINEGPETFAKYYDTNSQTLQHYKFPQQFLRTTKKAYLSFVTYEMLQDTIPDMTPSYDDIRYACWSAGLKCDLRYARKLHGSWLHQHAGLSSEEEIMAERYHKYQPALMGKEKIMKPARKTTTTTYYIYYIK